MSYHESKDPPKCEFKYIVKDMVEYCLNLYLYLNRKTQIFKS